MIEQSQDIVALLAESGVRTRRERAAFVAKLRDQMGLTFGEIGQQLHVTPQRAQQLYNLHKIFQRSVDSPFANLSTRARNFLNVVAHAARLPEDWEQNPALIAGVIRQLSRMRRKEALRYRHLGAHTLAEIEDFLRQRGIGFAQDTMEAQEDDFDPKEVTGGPLDPDQAAQAFAEFLNQKGFRGQFKIWPKGAYLPEPDDAGYDFTISITDFMSDAWEEQWQALREFGNIAAGLGYEYDVSGEPGEQRAFHFFQKRRGLIRFYRA